MFTNKYNLIESKELKLKILETVKDKYSSDLLPFYYYEILDKNNNSVGIISLKIGYNEYTIYNGNINCQIKHEYRGSNYSLKAMKLLKPLIQFHNIHSVILVIDEFNTASNKIAIKANGKLIGKLKVQKSYSSHIREDLFKNVYLINPNDW